MMKKNRTAISIAAAILAIGVVISGYFLFTNNTKSSPTIATAQQTGITEKINLYGQVKASQGVDLAFERQGKIVANYAKVGTYVAAGQYLAAIDSSDLQAQLKQAQAQLAAMDINIVKDRSDAGIQSLYTSALAAAQKSVTVAKNSLFVITDIQYSHFFEQNQTNMELTNAKARAALSLLGKDAGLWATSSLAGLNGGAFGTVQDAIENPNQENTDKALSMTLSALEDMRSLINAVPMETALTSAERTAIVAEKTNISLEIITTSNNIQAIATQKINNSATITTTNSQIEAAKAGIQAIKTQIAKTVIVAPFGGKIDKNDITVGSISTPNAPVITISNNNLEIQTGIPEIDMGKIKVGSKADISIDAFGSATSFKGQVVSIDSAQSLADGVAVYKARLKLDKVYEGITPGMTANISIIAGSKENTLCVPLSSIIQKNNSYFVIVPGENGKKDIREVQIGLKSADLAEIISGLQAGEKVLSY